MFKGYIRVGTDTVRLRYFLMSESITGSMTLGVTGDRTSDKKNKIELDNKQILGLALGFVISLALLVTGYYQYFTCLAILIIPALLYLIPHFFKVDDIKVMVMHGAVFVVVALLAGGLYAAPSYIDDNTDFAGNDSFTNATVAESVTGYDITVTFDAGVGQTPVAELFLIDKVGFSTVNGDPNDKTTLPGTQTGNVMAYSFSVDDQLYIIQFSMEDVDGNKTGQTFFFLTAYTSESNKNSAIWMGTLNDLGVYMLLYFMIVFLTYAMRSSAKKTRAKMVEQGRLYPEGYGRCKECNAIVLPGEVSCRKCGKYVDVPDEMKPKKKDFFTCSDCGAEIHEDAGKCPKCGVEFDGVEIEVQHADGTIEITDSTFECPICGSDVPATSEFCPKCGKTFESKE